MTDVLTIPSLATGTWSIDPAHSQVGFSVRHLMVSKVRGSFKTFSGTIVVPEDAAQATVEVSVDMSSVETGEEQRDNHLRSSDFFSIVAYPTMEFRSSSVAASGGDYRLAGDLTINGVSRPVTLDVEFNGVGPDPWGGTRAGFSAEAEISRKDFGITFDIPLDGGGVTIGDKVRVLLEVEAVLQQG
jgi:polyisoprenoid-binding protein YceI